MAAPSKADWTRESAPHRLDDTAPRIEKNREARLQKAMSTKDAIAAAVAFNVYAHQRTRRTFWEPPAGGPKYSV